MTFASDEEEKRLDFMEAQLAETEEAERRWLDHPDGEEVDPVLHALVRARLELIRRVAAVHRRRLRGAMRPPSPWASVPLPHGAVATGCRRAAAVIFVVCSVLTIAWGLALLHGLDVAEGAGGAEDDMHKPLHALPLLYTYVS